VKPLLLFLACCLTLTSFGAEWPTRLFAPYMYLGSGDHFQLTRCDDACGQKFYTLAFIIADKDGNPAWDGRMSLENNFYLDQISAIRERGGNVIVSFGGEGGTEISIAETNAIALEADYQSIIDRYSLTWLDFDIEGDSLAKVDANQRRNGVLAALQKKNPGLRITFTLPVDPDGISEESSAMLADAKSRGVKIYSANVMTMDYGERFSKGRKMSEVSIASVRKARKQCRKIDRHILIGVTAMIGQNDVRSEVLPPDDAQILVQWSKKQPWICSVSFWSSNRDAGNPVKLKSGNQNSGLVQKPWEFTRIFQSFTTTP
jgi:chitinase